ncbi:MAG: iron complex transport system substrate-binding protein [Cyclobacteriaceae bacterium]|jgi:iron complex transport system substrate-binding protein
MNMTKSALLLLLSLWLHACEKKKPSENVDSNAINNHSASKFKISDNQLTVLEPWPGATSPKTYNFKSSPKKVIVTSTTHLPYLEMLGVGDQLVGFPGTSYISSEYFRERVASGEIKDIGNDGNLNIELIIGLQPDLVIAFDMGNESTTLDKIEESGIPVLYNADFLETSALGRAEWIRFFGALFNKQSKADSIFNNIAQAYDSLKTLAQSVSQRPTVFSGVVYGDIWFLPGGENSAAAFYKDAGAAYIWESDSTSGWLEVSFESVFDKANDADYWVGISTFNTKEELISQDTRYGAFDAFQQDKIFTYSKRINPTGGYDYFETGYARPDLILADFISIFHPEILPDYDTYYYQKVE